MKLLNRVQFCDPVDCSLPGSSIHGISQARVLEWVAISFFRGSSKPGIEPRSPALRADALPSEPQRSSHFDQPVNRICHFCRKPNVRVFTSETCIHTKEVELSIHTVDTTQPQRESLLLDSKGLSTGKQQKSQPWIRMAYGWGGMVRAEA